MKKLVALSTAALVVTLAGTSVLNAQTSKPKPKAKTAKPAKVTPAVPKPTPTPAAPMKVEMTLAEAMAKAEAARKVIEDLAKTSIGVSKSMPSASVVFTGDKLITDYKLGSVVFHEEFTNINWAEYESVRDMGGGYEEIPVSFKFANYNIRKTMYKITVDGLITPMHDPRNQNDFEIHISASDWARVKELEQAAQTLSKLTKEKGNLSPDKATATPRTP